MPARNSRVPWSPTSRQSAMPSCRLRTAARSSSSARRICSTGVSPTATWSSRCRLGRPSRNRMRSISSSTSRISSREMARCRSASRSYPQLPHMRPLRKYWLTAVSSKVSTLLSSSMMRLSACTDGSRSSPRRRPRPAGRARPVVCPRPAAACHHDGPASTGVPRERVISRPSRSVPVWKYLELCTICWSPYFREVHLYWDVHGVVNVGRDPWACGSRPVSPGSSASSGHSPRWPPRSAPASSGTASHPLTRHGIGATRHPLRCRDVLPDLAVRCLPRSGAMVAATARPAPLRVYLAATSAAGLLVLAVRGGVHAAVSAPVAYWLLVGLLVASELRPITVPRRDEAYSVTISTTFAVALLLGWGLGAAAVSYALASVVGDLVHHRPPRAVLFNAAQYGLTLAAAGLVYHLLGGQIPFATSNGDLLAFLGAAVAFLLANNTLVRVASTLSHRTDLLASLRDDARTHALPSAIMFAVAPVTLLVATTSIALLLLFVVPLLGLYLLARTAVVAQAARVDAIEAAEAAKANE